MRPSWAALSKMYQLVFWTLILLLLGACRNMQNFSDAQLPRFEGAYAVAAPVKAADAPVKAITWNIKFSNNIDTAISELATTPILQDPDILLLQEMDEEGVEAIAQALKLNFVYFPASIHSHHERNFGNAILSPWPIFDGFKLVLPHQNPTNNQRRIAVRARIQIGSRDVIAYSVHTETFWLGPDRRSDQIETLLDDAEASGKPTVVGGDFNTLTPQSQENLTDSFAVVGFDLVSPEDETTMRSRGLSLVVDYIFARDATGLASGVWSETEASDHYPVWAELALP